jgi:hypothetical protein
MKLRPVCVVVTQDDAIKYYKTHDPITAKTKAQAKPSPLRMSLNYEGTQVQLHFCKRCGVAYVEAHSITFAEPDPTSVTSPSGGSA